MNNAVIETVDVQLERGSGATEVEMSPTGAIRFRGPQAWLATMMSWVLAPRRNERGVTTIEYIFGAILAIAIVTVVVGVIKNPAVGSLFMTLIEWVMKFRGE